MSDPVLLHHLLEQAPASTKVAIIDGVREWGYDALRGVVADMAALLVARGIRRGDRVGILLPKSAEECAAIFAISLAGGVLVPINPLLKAQQVRHIAADAGLTAIFSGSQFFPLLDEALAGLDGIQVIDAANVPARRAPVAEPRTIGEDLAAILYTSGSTGRPKGVMLSHRNLIAGTRIVRSYLGITADERILSVLPFSFDYGLNQLLTAMEQGATVILLGSFTFGEDLVRVIRGQRATALAGVPTLWSILARSTPSFVPGSLPSLRYVTNSGGRVPSVVLGQLRERLTGTDIVLMYGLTEAFRSTFLPPAELDRRPGSIGRAIPETEIFVVTEDGRLAPPGEPGTLVHRGPTVSMGYWRRPEDTARVLRRNPLIAANEGADMVCVSGDRVVGDAEGYFTFIGRDDAMIKSAGHRISPGEVEEAIMATGQFRQCAVIGLPDEFAGQVVHAVAVPVQTAAALDDLRRTLAEVLPAYMVPRRIEMVDALPTTPNGKVDYPRLVAERGP